uniref:MYM-type domain-containing protein n=1 Tax=viral metagenome TaxID=1070528 RepID=A0A6C0B724_9ZZZZ
MNPELVPKKRGRKKKEVSVPEEIVSRENITLIIEEDSTAILAPKKRGRKPKGGKLITKQNDFVAAQSSVTNLILHLKCSMQDLFDHNKSITHLVKDPMIYNPSAPPNILTYNDQTSSSFSLYNNEQIQERIDLAYSDFNTKPLEVEANICSLCKLGLEDNEKPEEDDINIKDVNLKLKKLKIQMYKNTNQDKKSACFWCTYEFDNPPCYVPKYEMDKEIYGYGSFCRPECAVAFLMKENIDDSTKFERYHLLNQIYSKVYDFKKNIKPAPNPYYLLDKFYGNLTIQEYRKLLKSEHMLLVIDKPMTRILPELHEDNEDFIINIYGGTNTQSNHGGVYKVKRESEKKQGPSKSSIIKDRFGVA